MITYIDGYPAANLILTPNHTQAIITLLTDAHGLLDYLHHNPDTSPELTTAAGAYLAETLSEHTLNTLIEALENLAIYLTWALRHTTVYPDLPDPTNNPLTDI